MPTTCHLRPGVLYGRRAVTARQMRLTASDGALVLRHTDGRQHRLAEQSLLDTVLLLSGSDSARVLGRKGSGPLAVVLAGDLAVVAVCLHDWAPPCGHDEDVLRRASRLDAFAQALHLSVEPASARRVAALSPAQVRSVLVVPGEDLGSGVPVRTVGMATGAATLAAVSGKRPRLRRAAAVAATVAAGAAARSALAARSAVPDFADAGCVTVRGAIDTTMLQVGAENSVLCHRGGEVVLDGPAAGGLTRLVVGPRAVRLVDRSGTDLVVMARSAWVDENGDLALLLAQAAAAGLSVAVDPDDIYAAITLD